jgi:hypothetical protein
MSQSWGGRGAGGTGATDVHTLAGAYALDALTEIERASFARHLTGCESCAAEVAGLTEAASRLAVLDAMTPPPRLRDAVLNEVYRTRQLTPAREASTVRSLPSTRTRWLAAVAAAVVALAGMAGVWAVQENRLVDARRDADRLLAAERVRAEEALALQRRVSAVLSAPDSQVRGADAPDGGRVTVVVAPSLGDGVAVLSDLPEPGPGRAYQLWLIDDGVAASAGVMAAGVGSGTALLDGLGAADTLGVTIEPASGSTQPTTPVLAGVALA